MIPWLCRGIISDLPDSGSIRNAGQDRPDAGESRRIDAERFVVDLLQGW